MAWKVIVIVLIHKWETLVDYCLLTNIDGTESSIPDIKQILTTESNIIGDIATNIQTNTVDKYWQHRE